MSTLNIKNPKLKDLDDKLQNIKDNKSEIKPGNLAFKSAHIGWRMVLELVIGIIIGIILGFSLDSFLNTSPIFLIILIFFGFAAGVRTMIKTAKEINKNIKE
ncbi:MAG: AtpZ/AtpI family protein [Paracoccaceae bacterium]|tara:strand:+ start:220 stop:525 length:306 start_codon:yes stop_codon:yes gene_type:complete